MQHDYGGHGLGTRLLQVLIDYARTRGIHEIQGLVLRENSVMLDLCKRLGFRLEPLAGEANTVSARLAVDQMAAA